MTWATKLAGVTLVQERLDEAKAFYTEVFELQAAFEDESNVVFKMGETIVHLLDVRGRSEPHWSGCGYRAVGRPQGPADDPGRRRRWSLPSARAARRSDTQRPNGPAMGDPDHELRRPRRALLGAVDGPAMRFRLAGGCGWQADARNRGRPLPRCYCQGGKYAAMASTAAALSSRDSSL